MKNMMRKIPTFVYRSPGRMTRTKRDRAAIEQLMARIQRERYLTRKQAEQRANEWAMRWHSFQPLGFR